MNRILAGILGLVLHLSAATVRSYGHDEPSTPAEQYQRLLEELRYAAPRAGVLSDEERLKLVGEVYRHRRKVALKLVRLAEAYPRDPVAVAALGQAVWQVNTRPWPVELVGRDDARARAFELLERDHMSSERLGTVCQRLAYGYCREYESFLRAVLDRSPHRSVRAQACLALARFLNNRQQRIDVIRERPDRAREFADLFGSEYIEELLRRNRAVPIREAEALFRRAMDEYRDVTVPGIGGVVGERAEAALFEMRHLVVGREAPDIEGEDQDGTRFKLSDYHGKVVLLNFWSEY